MKEIKIEMKKSVSENTMPVNPKRILMADDNAAIRDIVSGFLKRIGYDVALAVNGIEALAAFIETSFDLVLTDFEMPFMDGLSLAGRIKERSPSTPVILLTGADKETFLKKVESGQVDSIIFKPFMLEDLQRTVLGALGSVERGHAPDNVANDLYSGL